MSTKESILALLKESRGSYINGADAAEKLGVSGTAVWKAVNRLRDEGYQIEAVTNRGYRLIEPADLSGEAIAMCVNSMQADHPQAYGIKVEYHDSVDSTNNICRAAAAAGQSDGYTVIAGHQSLGRGRRGKNFWSPGGSGLYMSILVRPHGVDPSDALKLTTIAAVSVCEAIEAVSGEQASIKWVNDIFMNGRKVCGILTEASFDLEGGSLDYAVVGIGVNVFAPAGGFPEDIRETAGSVFTKKHSDAEGIRSRLAAEITVRFMERYRTELISADPETRSAIPAYIREYKRRCFVTGRDVMVIKSGAKPVRAHVTGIDDRCRLAVRYANGTAEMLDSGEISIIP